MRLALSPSQAIKLFARAVINHGGIPFELKVRQPNATSVSAMEELMQGRGHKVKSADALITDLTENKT